MLGENSQDILVTLRIKQIWTNLDKMIGDSTSKEKTMSEKLSISESHRHTCSYANRMLA